MPYDVGTEVKIKSEVDGCPFNCGRETYVGVQTTGFPEYQFCGDKDGSTEDEPAQREVAHDVRNIKANSPDHRIFGVRTQESLVEQDHHPSYQTQNTRRNSPDESTSQSTTMYPRRQKRYLPSGLDYGQEELNTVVKRARTRNYDSEEHEFLPSPTRPSRTSPQSPYHSNPTRPTFQEWAAKQSPILLQSFHVDTFTPGPLEQTITRQPGGSYEISQEIKMEGVGRIIQNAHQRSDLEFAEKPRWYSKKWPTAVNGAPTTDLGISDVKPPITADGDSGVSVGQTVVVVEDAPRTDSGFFDGEQSIAVEDDPSNDSGIVSDGNRSDDEDASRNKFTAESPPMAGRCETSVREEERLWKQVQWYRDKKKYSLYGSSQGKAEQAIFTRYKEIKRQRQREGQAIFKQRRYAELIAPSATVTNQQETANNNVSAHATRGCASPTQHIPPRETNTSPLGPSKGTQGGWQYVTQNGRDEQQYPDQDPSSDWYPGQENGSSNAGSEQAKHRCSPRGRVASREIFSPEESQARTPSSSVCAEEGIAFIEGTQGSELELQPKECAGRKCQDSLSPPSDEEVVCHVNGLFSLPGYREAKFDITLGELQRRAGPPENLTRVDMISYMRQAKTTGRLLLDKYHVTTSNRSDPTVLSRVCESEARLLANGIHKMNMQHLPMHSLADKAVQMYRQRECHETPDYRFKLRRRVVDVEITRNVLKEMQDILLANESDGILTNFELASHNFGVENLCNHLMLLDKYFATLMQHLQEQ